jgi:hypothetical protein
VLAIRYVSERPKSTPASPAALGRPLSTIAWPKETENPNTKFTPEGVLLSALSGSVGGIVGTKVGPTTGMVNFWQVGFPRTWRGVLPAILGGRAGVGSNARNAIYRGGMVSVGVSTVGPILGIDLGSPFR